MREVIKSFVLFFILFFNGICSIQADSIADSLMHIARKEKNPQKHIDKILFFSEEYSLSNSETSRELSEEALILSSKIDYIYGVAKSNYNISRAYLIKGDVEKAISLINISIDLFESNHHLKDLAHAYSLKSIIYGRLLQYNNAIEGLKKAIAIFEKIGDNKGLVKCLLNLAIEYTYVADFEKSISILARVEELDKELKGETHQYYLPVNYGSIYWETGDYSKALIYFEKALEGSRFLNIPDAEITSLHSIGLCYEKLNNNNKALNYYKEALLLAKIYKYDDETLLVLKDLTSFYEKNRDYKNAYSAINEFVVLKDTIYGFDRMNRISELEKKLEIEKRETVIKLKNLEIEKGKAEIKTGQYKMFGVSIASFLLLAVCGTIYFYYKKTKKLNSEILLQKLKVEEKNKEVLESINYAKRIQSSILLPENNLREIFKSYFVLYKPRDIVSGDFYWVYKTSSNKIIFAVADCTGHGVPGALMSMVGNGLLNETVIKNEIETADTILNELKLGLIKALGNHPDYGTKDGMDMSLCVWHQDSNLLEYAGANNSIYILRKDEQDFIKLSESNSNFKYYGSGLLEIKPDKQSVAFEEDKNEMFTLKTIQLKTDDILYLFSDGFADQFGGQRDKKFTYKKFKDLLIKVAAFPFDKQNEYLENDFNQWKANNEQVDDVCVFGVKI